MTRLQLDRANQPAQPLHPAATTTPQAWVKPTFTQVPLNDALSGGGGGPTDGAFTYSS